MLRVKGTLKISQKKRHTRRANEEVKRIEDQNVGIIFFIKEVKLIVLHTCRLAFH